MSMMTFAKQRREKAEAVKAAADKLAQELAERAESFLAERRAREEADLKAREIAEAVEAPAEPEAEDDKPTPRKRGRKPKAVAQDSNDADEDGAED